MEVVNPTLPVESMMVDGTAPPELVGVAVRHGRVVGQDKPVWIEIGASSFSVALTEPPPVVGPNW